MDRTYIAIDLKSFYASVECVERGLDPLDACLVVADKSRTEKTICLAVSPALKAYGTGGRPRLFEVVSKVRAANRRRGSSGFSTSGKELAVHPELKIDYIVAPPRMALYVDYSTRIYGVYLRYIAPDDIHVYSIDEVFIDATGYLKTYGLSAHELAIKMIREVLAETGVTATAGIGTNLYLSKVAMDIVAKKMPPDKDGVRIAELDELSYRQKLWDHTPLTDFWRVGRGTARKLEDYGILTMGDIARCSLEHEGLFYQLMGINAELLIDHAWGWEPVRIEHIKAYRPESKSISTGQVLSYPYDVECARIVAMEMADNLALELTEKDYATDQLTLTIGYDMISLDNAEAGRKYRGAVVADHYGRSVPQHSHGTINFPAPTAAATKIMKAVGSLYDRLANPHLFVRRLTICANNLKRLGNVEIAQKVTQLDLFTDYERIARDHAEEVKRNDREIRFQRTIVSLKQRFGKNAVMRGLNYDDGATQRDRNGQIGGHKA